MGRLGNGSKAYYRATDLFLAIWVPLSVYAARSLNSPRCEHQDFFFEHCSKIIKIKTCECRFPLSKAALFQGVPLHPKNGLWWSDLKEVLYLFAPSVVWQKACRLKRWTFRHDDFNANQGIPEVWVHGYWWSIRLALKCLTEVRSGPNTGLMRLVHVDGMHLFALLNSRLIWIIRYTLLYRVVRWIQSGFARDVVVNALYSSRLDECDHRRGFPGASHRDSPSLFHILPTRAFPFDSKGWKVSLRCASTTPQYFPRKLNRLN